MAQKSNWLLCRRVFAVNIACRMKNALYPGIQTGLLLLLLLVGVAVNLPAAAGQERQDSGALREGPEGATSLPEGEAKAIILSGCVQCHNLSNTASQRKTADRWRRTVNEMIWRGAPLTADESEAIIKYLAVSLGPDKPMPAVRKSVPRAVATGSQSTPRSSLPAH